MSFFSREELLQGGLPAHRATLLLFAIESRTARLVEQERRGTALYLTLASPPTREQEFLGALAGARGGEPVVTIQQIEQVAPQWSVLLPATTDASLNAALIRLIAHKYQFARAEVPNLRRALQLDGAAVPAAFLQLHGQPLESIYTRRESLFQRARWEQVGWARQLESLPPFWLAFFLTMPGAAGLLGVPVSLARAGIGGGILLLVLFGLVNAYTASALAEATARAGVTRLGLGWLGQLVQEYLGSAGSIFLTAILALNNFFVLIIFYLGVGGTLQDATHLPAELWVILTFAVGLFVLSRGSLNATIATTLLIVFASLFLLVLIPLLALPYFQIANFSTAPVVSLDFTSLQAAFGLLLSTYFSHLLVATYGPVVIRRDANARSWIRGSATAVLVFMLVACLWLVVLDGVIPADALARTTGTVISPLAERVGSVVSLLGSLLVILSLGLLSVQISLGLFYMVQERLPAPKAPSALADRRVRFMLSIIPLGGVFVLAEWFAVTGAASFANFLGILSAFVLPLLGGVLPVLLLASTRRKGDFVPGLVSRWRTHPLLLSLVYLFSVGIIFAYGLVIYQDLPLRALMMAVGLITLAVTGVMLRRGALAPRLVIQVQDDERPPHTSGYSVVANGEPIPARVQVNYADGSEIIEEPSHTFGSFEGLRAILLHLSSPAARECKLWAFRLTSDGGVQGLRAQVEIQQGAECRQLTLSEGTGETILPLDGSLLEVKMEFK